MNLDRQLVQPPGPLFALLRDFVHERTGIWFSEENAPIFTGKLSSLMTECGYSSYLDYYHLLRNEAPDGLDLQRLISTITVGETWFFRERPQLDALISIVLPKLIDARDTDADPIRIWSAACATGEEPLTLAMLIDATHREWFSRLTIVATDINTIAIARARAGMFRERAFRNISPQDRSRYFRSADGIDRIDPAILSRVEFAAGSLLDPAIAHSPADIILCRNVLIYFDDRSTYAAMRRFAEILRPDGYLLLGSSESLLRYSLPWTLSEIGGSFFYTPRTGIADPWSEVT